jgi:hypothetical protein
MRLLIMLLLDNRLSANDVLPWSTCATIVTFCRQPAPKDEYARVYSLMVLRM